MNVNLLQGLFIGTDPVGGAAGDANAALRRHHAWQSAMEQAQMANWFKPGGATSSNVSTAPAAHAATATLLAQSSSESSAQSAPAASADGVMQVPEASRESPAPSQASAAAASANLDAAPTAAQVSAESTPPHQRLTSAPAVPLSLPIAALSNVAQSIDIGLPAPQGLSAPGSSLSGSAAISAVNPAQPSSPACTDTPLSLRAIAAQVGQWLETPELEASESVAGAEAPFRRLPEQESSDAAARLHVEWTREGARLWLGVDHDQLQRVPTLVGQLQQWLASSGVKLLALVCNGRPVYLARRAFQPSFPPQGDLA